MKRSKHQCLTEIFPKLILSHAAVVTASRAVCMSFLGFALDISVSNEDSVLVHYV